jgi:hypothetical protein
MRKTVQEWMDANQQSAGPAKKKVAGLKRLKQFGGSAVNGAGTPVKRRAKKKAPVGKRRPK